MVPGVLRFETWKLCITFVNMGRSVELCCFALVLLFLTLPIGTMSSSYQGTQASHQRQLATQQPAENANLECLTAFRSSVVDSTGYLEEHWNLEGMTVCDLAHVECSAATGLLTRLDLMNVGLSGGFPTGLSKCSSLTNIALSYNNFKGPLPTDLCLQLPLLVELDLSWNFFTGDVYLLHCSFLTKLHLDGNLFSEGIAFSNCTSLTTLSLFHNNFTGKLPQDLCTALPSLTELDLSHNQFAEEIGLSNCTSLVELDLSHNNLSGEIPDALWDSRFLRTLSLQNNLLNGTIPQSLGLLPELSSLDLSYNALYGTIPSSFLDNPRLSYSDLMNNAHLCGPAKLMPQDMYDDWECLGTFKSSVLDRENHLASWNMSCMFPGNICSFEGVDCWSSGLVSGLMLKQSGLAGPFPSGLSKCKMLGTLSLAQNTFAGPLPADICDQIPSLTELDLSSNRFTGDIPTALGNCKALTTLLLQNNLFSGGIPSALGMLPSLGTLNISSNDLSGSVPSFLRKPSFGAASIANNPHLCGPPLASQCASQKRSPRHILEIATVALFALVLLLVVMICRLQKKACKSSRKSAASLAKMFDTCLRVTWEDLQRATSGFSQANLIGSGGSSKVYQGKLLNGRMVAIKVLVGVHGLVQEMELSTPKQFFTELDILGKLRHRNLVRILGYCFNLDTMAIILDFMPLGSLNALLHQDTPCHGSIRSRQRKHLRWLKLDWKVRLSILTDIAEGLVYLHHEYDRNCCIIHGDLKPGNVLLDAHMKACIADFGLARMVQNINTGLIATPSRQIVSGEHWCSFGYTAPEVTQQGVVSRKADIFSFGVTMLEVVTGERPNSSRLEENQTLANWVGKAVEKGEPQSVVAPLLKETEWTHSSDDIVALLKLGCACASHVPSTRPDMYQVLTFLQKLVVKQTHRMHSSAQVHPVDSN